MTQKGPDTTMTLAPPFTTGRGCAVEIQNLSFAYHSTSPVLENLSVRIEPGECFGILGPSGAGKSTLLLHLNGLLQGTAGTIHIDDTAINTDTLPLIRKKVGLVFQNPEDQLFHPTVEEDVAFGPRNMGLSRAEAAARVRQALAAMKLEGFEQKSAHHLSFGEKKRVALATVLSMEPEVVAFDEPFSNLDPAMVYQLMGIIRELPATIVLVSQSILPALACCQRVGILAGGSLRRVGTPQEIARDRNLLTECGLDFRYYCDICREIGCLAP
ncbi:MAG: ABC transporter ATP-binding protein [Acidobacteria bacterium]|nr:ABC transporter ATP-binding protein [Acidobacteriota bacterium]